MKLFKQFYEDLNEGYTVNFDYDRDRGAESSMNDMDNPSIGNPANTRAFQSDKMKNASMYLIRWHNPDDEIEYHLSTDRSPYDTSIDPKNLLTIPFRHAVSILNQDVKPFLEQGKKVKIQCLPERKFIYNKIIDHLIKDHPEYTKELGLDYNPFHDGLMDTFRIFRKK